MREIRTNDEGKQDLVKLRRSFPEEVGADLPPLYHRFFECEYLQDEKRGQKVGLVSTNVQDYKNRHASNHLNTANMVGKYENCAELVTIPTNTHYKAACSFLYLAASAPLPAAEVVSINSW